MIQPNEKLLPGNVVMWHDKPYTLDAKDIWHISIDIKTFRNVISPIPLTPEILASYAIIKQNLGDIKLLVSSVEGKWVTEVYFKGEFVRIISHLHELQNTVYFLSGEEMPVNIPNH